MTLDWHIIAESLIDRYGRRNYGRLTCDPEVKLVRIIPITQLNVEIWHKQILVLNVLAHASDGTLASCQ